MEDGLLTGADSLAMNYANRNLYEDNCQAIFFRLSIKNQLASDFHFTDEQDDTT